MKTMEIAKNLQWIGNLDPDLRIFDIVIRTDYGTSYNSYVYRASEKNVIFEASKMKFLDEYLDKLTETISLNDIDYIIVSHTEPDHTGTIEKLLDLNPKLKIVGTSAGISFMKEICNKEFDSIVVKDGDTLSLGDKTLRFISAPNLHWPDTMFTYIVEDQILVTCDAFGAHYCFDGITNETLGDKKEEYLGAVKFYFDSIVAPFKSNVLDAVKKVENLDIKMICTGHGPVLTKDPMEIVELYRELATEQNPNPKKTVVIPYVSAYGYTEIIAHKIAEGICEAGDIEVKLFDMVQADPDKVLEELYWADGVLFGSPTFVGEALKPIWDLLTAMIARTHGKKIASAFGAYGWSGEAVGNLMGRLKQLNMKLYREGLRIKFKPSDTQALDAFNFGYGFGASVLAGEIIEVDVPTDVKKKVWKCRVCGQTAEGEEPPARCPVCGVGPDKFVEVE